MADTFLYLQNHAVSIRPGSASLRTVPVGDFTKSYNGKPLSTVQHIRREWDGVTPWLVPAEARFLVALLTGQGHTWSFDDTEPDMFYSSKGLAPSTSTAAAGRNTTAKKFGASGIELDQNTTLSWDVGYTFDWTVMVWRGDADFSPNNHYIVNSSGHKWVDGVRNDAASTPFIAMSAGVFTLGDATEISQQFSDDLVIIPEKITATWAEDFGTMTAAFGPLPLLRTRGAFHRDNVYWTLGKDVAERFAQGTVSGTFYNDLTEVSFTLEQHTRIS